MTEKIQNLENRWVMRWGGGINVGHSAEQELEHYGALSKPRAETVVSKSAVGEETVLSLG